MNNQRLLLCTDMDRTVIPNGAQTEHPDARRRFAEFCGLDDVTLVYVSGRHQALVQEAVKNYALPQPDYAITDVGTKIYRAGDEHWLAMDDWELEIDKDWNGKSHHEIKQLLSVFSELRLQELSKQNTHKLSYYLPANQPQEMLLMRMQDCLQREGVDASLIWSVDEPNSIGLLDVLPRHATKLHAVEFLQRILGYGREEVIFAGDSGNDLAVLSSPVYSVLVANATDEVKSEALRLAESNGNLDTLYIARAEAMGMNGNYSAGVLEGVWHFAPGFRGRLSVESGET